MSADFTITSPNQYGLLIVGDIVTFFDGAGTEVYCDKDTATFEEFSTLTSLFARCLQLSPGTLEPRDRVAEQLNRRFPLDLQDASGPPILYNGVVAENPTVGGSCQLDATHTSSDGNVSYVWEKLTAAGLATIPKTTATISTSNFTDDMRGDYYCTVRTDDPNSLRYRVEQFTFTIPTLPPAVGPGDAIGG